MAGVTRLHQESEDVSTPEWIRGHYFNALSVLVGAGKACFALPLVFVAARRWHQVQTHPKGREKRHKKREDYSGHQNGGPLRYLRGGRELCNFGCLFRLQTSAQKFSPERLASNHKSALLHRRRCPLLFRVDADGERTTTGLGEFDKTRKAVRSGGGLSDS